MLAARVAGALWLVAAVTLPALLLVPSVDDSRWEAVLAVAAASAAWGTLCLVLIDWREMPARVFHVATLAALATIGGLVALTGGAESPVWILLFYVAAYCAYFYERREAVLYLIGCAAVCALPFAYDEEAVDEGLAEFLLAGPAFLVIGGVIFIGKRRLVALREEAQQLSMSDPLTGLPNRRALMDRLNEVGGHRRSDATGLLMLDIDDFKGVNTRYGHPGGDRVLQETADVLRRSARAEDLIGRFGGDEFAVVVNTPTPEALRQLAERVLWTIRGAGPRLGLSGLDLTVSVGWALYPEDARDSEELVRAADASLRASKASGKDRAEGSPDASR